MVKLLAIGTALPPGLLHQQNAFEMAKCYNSTSAREDKVLRRLYQRTLIASRPTILNGENKGRQTSLHDFYPMPTDLLAESGTAGGVGTATRMARYKEEIGPLALQAARQALAKTNLPLDNIDNLVTVSCTGFFSPGLDTQLIEQLSLRREISRTHVGFMGCHGAMNGLRVGSALANQSRSISLVVAAELCSLHFQYGRKTDDILANALFADGAAAALLSFETADLLQNCDKQSNPDNFTLLASASYLLPDSKKAMTWEIGDHGFVMTLGAEVPGLIEKHLQAWLKIWLAKFDLDIRDIASWAVHPGGPRILDAVQSALALDTEALAASRQVFTSLGNMSSPTILFIVERLLAAAAPGPLVALAFGPGLTIEAALFI